MIDLHCHILPQIDDGPKSWETALEMCRIAREEGIDHMVATPHANERYDYDRELCTTRMAELRQRTGELPRFTLGCEFHLSYDNLEDAFVHPHKYTLGNTRYLLVELSDFGIPPQIGQSMFRLRSLGLTPILAHPERNPILQRNLSLILDWVDQGCLLQLTASSLAGFWGEKARNVACILLDHDAVHVIASDAHDDKHRVPRLGPAREFLARQYGPHLSQALLEDNPRAIVADQPVPYPASAASA